jgi:hypothetical protein
LLDGARLELGELKAYSTLLGACTTYPLLRSDLEASAIEIKDLKHKLGHSSGYKLGVGFEWCEDKGEKSAPKFIPSSTHHKEEATIKPTKAHYPSNPKPSFNPKREARKETPKPGEEAFVCMFCGCVGHLDDFCFFRKRIEKRRIDYARNSYCDE